MVPLLQWGVGDSVYSIALSKDGTRVASGSEDIPVRIWDVHTGTLVLSLPAGHTDAVRSVAWSHDSTRLVSGSNDNTIRVWDTRTGTPVGQPLKGHTSWVGSVAFSPDNTRIVSGSFDRTIRIWDAHTGAPIGEPLSGHTESVYSVVFSPDNTRIASGSYDSTIRIWDAHTGALMVESLKEHTGPVLSVAYSSDNAHIVSGSKDCTIRIWDARTGVPIGEPLRGHTKWVWSVAFSHGNTHIVSGSDDHTIRIWDARTGALVGRPLKTYIGRVNTVAFLPDNTRIVSASDDGTIDVWEAPSFDMVTKDMSAQEMFDALVKHGCTDLSSSVDAGRYSSSPIASGGFGDVWQAWMRNGVLVAVKCFRQHVLQGDPKAMKHTTREIYNWSKLRHENIHELLGIVIFRDRLGMVSLWMPNGNLQQYIQKNPSVERYPLCLQVTKGMEYMHEEGMVHGDLKAVNILVSADGIAKISDFDYSILSESTLQFSETSKKSGGTIRWMAPELLLGEEDDSPYAARSKNTDVYALGMTMLEIISGNLPYHQYQRDVSITRALDRKELPKRPDQLSGPDGRSNYMWALLLECWDYDASARPDASSVLASLQSFTI